MTRAGRVAAAFGVAIVALVAVGWWLLGPPSMRPFDDEVARLAAEGFATSYTATDADLDDPDNGAREAEALWADLVAERGEPSSWGVTGPWDFEIDASAIAKDTSRLFEVLAAMKPWHERATPERKAELGAILADLGPIFDRIDAVLAKPHLRWPQHLTADGFPDSSWLRPVGRLKQLVEARAFGGASAEERVAGFRTYVRFARHRELDAFSGGLTVLSWRTEALTWARDAVERGELSASSVRAALDRELVDVEPDWFAGCARVDVVSLVRLYPMLLDGSFQTMLTALRPPRTRSDRLKAWFRKTIGRAAPGDVLPSPADAAAALRARAEIAHSGAASHRELLREVVARNAALHEMLRFDVTATTFVRHVAAARLARVALAVKAHHERDGAWPETPDQAWDPSDGAMPLDPFRDEAFLFERTDEGVRLRAAPSEPGEDADLRENGLLWEFRR